jgi:hypothetical protein
MATRTMTAKAVAKPVSVPCSGGIPSLSSPAVKSPIPVSQHKPCPEEIRVRAYSKRVSAGRPPGNGVCFWLQAEKELCNQA